MLCQRRDLQCNHPSGIKYDITVRCFRTDHTLLLLRIGLSIFSLTTKMENKNKSSGFAAETDRDHWDEEGLHPFRCIRNTLEGEGGGCGGY